MFQPTINPDGLYDINSYHVSSIALDNELLRSNENCFELRVETFTTQISTLRVLSLKGIFTSIWTLLNLLKYLKNILRYDRPEL